MGIIYKQSLRGTIVVYLGVVIGFVTTGLIFPKVLEPEQIGLVNILVSYALIFSQFGLLGLQNITTRLFTYFRDAENNHKGFFFIGTSIAFLGFLLVTVIFLILKPHLVKKGIDNYSFLCQYVNYIIPLIFFLIFFSFLDTYYKVLFKAVKGVFFQEFIRRLLLLIAICLFYFHLLNYHEFVISYVIAFCLPTVLIFLSLLRNKQISLVPQLKHLSPSMGKTMAAMGLFGILSNTTTILNIHTERILVDHYLGLNFLGIYTTAYVFGSLVGMPARMIKRISSVVIADAWKDNNKTIINDIYFKTCLNQFVIGLFILIGLFINIDNIFTFLPAEYAIAKNVLILIAVANLLNMISSGSGTILITSKYYWVLSVFKIIMLGTIVGFNILLLPRMGITGVAMAALIAYFVFHMMKFIFVWARYKMQPYNAKFLVVLFVGLVAGSAGYYFPEQQYIILDILLRSIVMSIVYFVLVMIFNISDDINLKVKEYARHIKKNNNTYKI